MLNIRWAFIFLLWFMMGWDWFLGYFWFYLVFQLYCWPLFRILLMLILSKGDNFHCFVYQLMIEVFNQNLVLALAWNILELRWISKNWILENMLMRLRQVWGKLVLFMNSICVNILCCHFKYEYVGRDLIIISTNIRSKMLNKVNRKERKP